MSKITEKGKVLIIYDHSYRAKLAFCSCTFCYEPVIAANKIGIS
jgi:hypothetical protein